MQVHDLTASHLEAVPAETGPGQGQRFGPIDAIYFLAKIGAVAALACELLIVVSDVIGRALFHHSFLWSDEAARLALAAITFLGGAVAYRDRGHTTVEIVQNLMPPRARLNVVLGVEWLVVILSATTAYVSFELVTLHWDDPMPMLRWSTAWFFLPVTVGLSLIALFGLERLVGLGRYRMSALIGAVLVAIAIGVGELAPIDALAAAPNTALAIMIGLFFAAVLLGLPVSFAMILATILYLVATDTAPPIAIPQNMVDGIANFVLLALPFFICAGLVMERGGISVRLVRLAMALVGRLRGGLLQVVVFTIFLVSGISGSKVADVAAVGSVMREELRRRGYRAEDGAAVLAASAAMAETIPPSIAMLVLGSVTPISIGTLFIAGLVPAAVIAICLMGLIYGLSWLYPTTAETPDAKPKLAAVLIGAVLPMAMPVAMVIGIRFGLATPTEISAFAVLYGLVLAILVYRETDLADLARHAAAGVSMSGVVLFVIAAASAFAWVLSAANLPQRMVQLLQGTGPTPFMIGSVALLIVVGSLLEGLPAIIILAPLLLPIATGAGLDPVQYAIVLILSMGIGAFMPPIGIGFYVSVAVARSNLERSARAMLPYLVVLVLAVLLIAFVPEITLALPRRLAP